MAKKDSKKLAREIRQHRKYYHQLDSPIISDQEYDSLVNEYLAFVKKWPHLEKKNPLKTGFSPLAQFTKVAHKKPMLSLQNSFSSEDIFQFDSRVKKNLSTSNPVSYFCEPKLDGVAIEVIYKRGIYTQAITRGDGVTGEDVTQNVATISSLPKKLKTKNPPELLEIRAEIVILKNDFKKLNKDQEKNKEKIFANSRNAAAGSIRQLDPKIAASRPLRIFAYSHGDIKGLKLSTQEKFLKTLESFDIPTLRSFKKQQGFLKLCKSPQEVMKHFEKIEKARGNLEYDMDGLVVKVNDFAFQKQLGNIARSPRWATSLKVKAELAETQIEKIITQVGRTGALTPVAIMKPVQVGGVIVSQATLHNQDEIDRKDIRPRDTVVIQRAGDVIPEVVRVKLEKRKSSAKKFILPKHCPTCNTLAVQAEDEVISRCPNKKCPARIKGALSHFVSRRAMNIDKLGEKIVEKLFDYKLVQNFSDIYKLNEGDLVSLDRQGKKSATNILKSIERSRTCTLSSFIYSLGIRFVGEQTAKALAQNFKNIDELFKADKEKLEGIDDIGETVAQSIVDSLKDPDLKSDIKKLVSQELKIQPHKIKAKQGFSGLRFAITGTLQELSRDEATQFIEKHGGKISNSISKKTNYLIKGHSKTVGTKEKSARKEKLPVITWKDVIALTKRRNAKSQ